MRFPPIRSNGFFVRTHYF